MTIEPYQASNAFGAKFQVERSTEEAIGVVDGSKYDEKWKVYWTKQLDGAFARDTTRNLQIRISGILGTWPGGQSVVCGRHRIEPTITAPTDKTANVCAFYGRVDTLEFINGTSGEILYSARRSPRQTGR